MGSLGNIISPIVMGIIYFAVVTPIALLLKIINKDVLSLKKNKTGLLLEKQGKIQ